MTDRRRAPIIKAIGDEGKKYAGAFRCREPVARCERGRGAAEIRPGAAGPKAFRRRAGERSKPGRVRALPRGGMAFPYPWRPQPRGCGKLRWYSGEIPPSADYFCRGRFS